MRLREGGREGVVGVGVRKKRRGMRWSGTVVLSCLSVCVGGAGGVFFFQGEERRSIKKLFLGGRKKIAVLISQSTECCQHLERDASVSLLSGG